MDPRKKLVTLLILACLSISPCSANDQDWHGLVAQAKILYKTNRLKESITLLRQARDAAQTASATDQAEILYRLGLSYSKDNNLNEAETCLTEALTKSAGDEMKTKIQYTLGRTFRQDRNLHDAEKHLREALALSDSNARTQEQKRHLQLVLTELSSVLEEEHSPDAAAVKERASALAIQDKTDGTAKESTTFGTTRAPNPQAQNIIILLDASKSMSEKPTSNYPEIPTKLDAAKKSIRALLKLIPPTVNVGLRTFGETLANQPLADCTDTRLLVALGPRNTKKILEELNKVSAAGLTPTTYALQQVYEKDLDQAEGSTAIVLLSDDNDSCGQNPVAYVANRTERGKAEIVVISMTEAKNRRAQQQFSEIAAATGGSFFHYPVSDEQFKAIIGWQPQGKKR